MERISKMWRSGLSLILALCLIISACPVVAFAAENDEINYVSLGDSMANGYGMHGYAQGDQSTAGDYVFAGKGMYAYDAYPMLFEQYLQAGGVSVNHTKLATSGMIATDLMFLLGGIDERLEDGWTGFENYLGIYWEHFDNYADGFKKQFCDAVADADIITLGLGNGSFGAYMMDIMTKLIGLNPNPIPSDLGLEKALALIEGDEAFKKTVNSMYNNMRAKLVAVAGGMDLPFSVETFCDVMVYAGAAHMAAMKGSLKQIAALNDKDLEVVLVGMANTMNGIKFVDPNGGVFDFGGIMDVFYKSMNVYLAGLPTAMQALGELEGITFYYTDVLHPELVSDIFLKLYADGTWKPAYDLGMDVETLRLRTIQAVADFVFANIVGQDIADTLKGKDGIVNLIREGNFYPLDFTNDSITGAYVMAGAYNGIEKAVADNMGTKDIPLESMAGMADLMNVIGPALKIEEMTAALVTGATANGATIDAKAGMQAVSDMVYNILNSGNFAGMCTLFGMTMVGNGIVSHPSAAGHNAIANAVIEAYETGHTAKDEVIEKVQLALSALKGFLEEYGPQAADQAYKMWVEMGYQEEVNKYIDELNDAVTDRYTNYTEVILPAMNDAIDALNGQKDALNAELVTLKDQLTAKKAELLKVLSEQEITDITPPDFNIETELGNNEQTQVPENDCAGAGNVADELAAAIADLEHAIAVVEALIADVNADIEDMVALATEIAEGIASLEQTIADIATAAQDMKDAVDAVIDVLTNESAQATSKTFMNAFNAARDAAQIAVEAVELLVETVNDDFAAIEASVETLKECADALVAKFDKDKEAILGQIMADIPMEGAALVAAPIMMVQQALEQNKDAIIAALNAEKDALLVELNKEKDALLVELNNEKDALLAEYGPQIDKALADISNLQTTIDTEIQTAYAALQSEAQGKIDALKQNAQIEIDKLNAELQGYMDQLAGDISDELRAEIQPQIDRINNDIATINADLADAISHVNVELQNAYNALVAEVTNAYNQAMTELKNIHDALVEEYNNAVKALQDVYDSAVKNLQDAYDAAVKALQDAADKAINDLIAAAQKELDKLGQIGDMLNDMANGIFDAIRNDISNVQGAVAGILNGVQGSVDNLADALVDTAVDGINALVDEVTDIINGMIYESTHSDLELEADSVYVALGDGTAAPEGYAEELYAQLNAEYGVTGFKNYATTGNTVGAELQAMAYNRPMVADADLITIGFGNVTLLNNAIRNAGRVDYNWAELVGEDLVPYVEDALNEAFAKVEELGLPANWEARAKGIIEGVAYGTVEYMVELPELISAIRAVNPDAVIVIVGQYNPMDGVVLDLGGVTLDVSEYIDYFVEGVSAYGIGYSMITGDAIFVEAPEVATKNTDMSWTEDELMFDLLLDGFSALNPNEAGAVYIANQILDALNITKIESGLWGDANNDGKVNVQDAILILKVASGDEEKVINRFLSDVTGDGKIGVNDAIFVLKRSSDDPTLFPVEK